MTYIAVDNLSHRTSVDVHLCLDLRAVLANTDPGISLQRDVCQVCVQFIQAHSVAFSFRE